MRRRGFTLIELSVVIVILAMFAAAVVPNMATSIESAKRRSFRVSVLTLARRAKVEAITRGATVNLSLNNGDFQISSGSETDSTVIGSVSQAPGIEASHFTKAGEELGEGEWLIAFYPDGTSDGGAFQFDEGSDSTSVKIAKKDGRVSVTDGALDPGDTSETEWEAGGYVQSN